MKNINQILLLNAITKMLAAGLLLVIFGNCSASRESSRISESPQYIQLAADILGDSLEYAFNWDSTMVLCQTITPDQYPPVPREVHYCVIDVNAGEVIHQAHMANGSVAWHGKKEIAVRNYKGYPTVNDEDLYIYNLETGRRTPLYPPDSQKEE